MKCGCQITIGSVTVNRLLNESAPERYIIFCPLHAAAPEMLEACRKALAFVLDGQLVAHRSFGPLLGRAESAELLRQVIAKAERGTV